MEESKDAIVEPSMGSQQFAAAISEQSHAFEQGVAKLADDAFKAGMHPVAVATANIRLMARVAATIAAIQNLDAEKWEEMVRCLFEGVIADMKNDFDEYCKGVRAIEAVRQASAVAA